MLAGNIQSLNASELSRDKKLRLPSRLFVVAESFYHVVKNALDLPGKNLPLPYFTDPSLAVLELAPSISKLDTLKSRFKLYSDVLHFAKISTTHAKYVTSKLPHLLWQTPVKEKMEFLRLVLKGPNHVAVKRRMCFAIVRSCQNRQELFELISPKARQLVELGYLPLNSIIAKTEILKAFSSLKLPSGLYNSKFALKNEHNSACVKNQLTALSMVVDDILVILASLRHFKHVPHRQAGVQTRTVRLTYYHQLHRKIRELKKRI